MARGKQGTYELENEIEGISAALSNSRQIVHVIVQRTLQNDLVG